MELFGCTRCKQELPGSAFSPSQIPLKGRWCRACQNQSRRDKRAGIAPARLFSECQVCGEDIRSRRAHARWCSSKCASIAFRMANPTFQRGYQLKTSYGITVEEFNRMLSSQNGKCALCKEVEVGAGPAKGQWNVDHDHATGAVRGILCSPCNIGIGLLKDSPTLLRAAIQYLERVGH